ncbi:ArsR/SmtB family transcription factor [Nocardiopsis mangrovi]|uniref:ArsR/SmtB family transcription factor n=1 Tax=Nocardiopsis mangrovi TaxID=1179818 RepID=A0ABV9E241_9ACTN
MASDECELLCLDLPHAEDVRLRVVAEERARTAAERAKALADPTRLRIASALQAGDELCVCDLAWVCGASKNLVSHHVRQLRIAGLAASRRDGKLVMYRLTDTGTTLLATLIAPTAVQGE